MLILTQLAVVQCAHMGMIPQSAGQALVSIGSAAVLVEPDPVGRAIGGCPIAPPAGKPCTSTLPVQKGYSGLLRINGHRICLDTLSGFTYGTPPGTVKYQVTFAGQVFVEEA